MATQELIRNASLSVGTDVVLVSDEQFNTTRNVIFITNTSTGGQKVTIAPDGEAIAGQGIVLVPGGFYQDSADQGYKPTNKRITAIANAAGGTIAVHERIIMQGY
jgi:hypothetical protein